tara:strand:+ start:722 stop:1060 length:339 start_codon:yes stop_codon:yes gene_type:complete
MNNKPYISYEIKENKIENTLTVQVALPAQLAAQNREHNIPWQKITTRYVRQLLAENDYKAGTAITEAGSLNNAESAVSGTWVFESLLPSPAAKKPSPSKKRPTQAKTTKSRD